MAYREELWMEIWREIFVKKRSLNEWIIEKSYAWKSEESFCQKKIVNDVNKLEIMSIQHHDIKHTQWQILT